MMIGATRVLCVYLDIIYIYIYVLYTAEKYNSPECARRKFGEKFGKSSAAGSRHCSAPSAAAIVM